MIDISYEDEFYIKLKLNNLSVTSLENIYFLSQTEKIEYGFCKKIEVADDILTLNIIPCKTKVDDFLETLQKNDAKKLKVEIDGDVLDRDVIYVDDYS